MIVNPFEGKLYDAESFKPFVDSMISQVKDSAKTAQGGKFRDTAFTGAGSYLEQQLTYIVPKVLEQKYAATPAPEIFSISNEGNLEKILVRRMKGYSGEHQREHENKSNPTKASITVSYDASGLRIEDFEATSIYKEIDLLRAAKYNDSLDASIIQAHDMSYKKLIDKIAFLGMTDEQGNTLTEGLLNNSNVDSNLSVNATGAFTGLTGLQIYTDIKNLVALQNGATGGLEELMADTLVCSPSIYAILRSTTYGTSSSDYQNHKSIMQMIQENLGITLIKSTNNAIGVDTGVGGEDRLCVFNRSADNMTLYIPQPLKFSEVVKTGFDYKIWSMARVAGLGINQKIIFAYLKGC